jgi:hypothetical protein
MTRSDRVCIAHKEWVKKDIFLVRFKIILVASNNFQIARRSSGLVNITLPVENSPRAIARFAKTVYERAPS